MGIHFSIVSHVSFSQFCGEDEGFHHKDDRFLAKMTIFLYFLHLCRKSVIFALHTNEEVPTLSMCRHSNEGIPSTEHLQMLHWVCTDILVRGNPLTDKTDNTENTYLN